MSERVILLIRDKQVNNIMIGSRPLRDEWIEKG